MTTAVFVPSAEAAFIAELSDRDMNRVFDERLVPESLVRAEDGRRLHDWRRRSRTSTLSPTASTPRRCVVEWWWS